LRRKRECGKWFFSLATRAQRDALLALLRIKELLKAQLTINPDPDPDRTGRASPELQQPLLELPTERKEYR
jgi:hypothetical protein